MSAGVASGHTVLQVPVPALEPFVRARHHHYDPEWVSTDPAYVHAHVTALGPWLTRPTPSDLAVVAGVAAATAPFEAVLARVATFANGIIHLVPEPEEPFRVLTRRLTAAFPSCRPYAGEFDPAPHLTLDARSPTVSEASTRRLLGDLVPARVRVDRLDLAWYATGDCRLLHRWALGAGGSPLPS